MSQSTTVTGKSYFSYGHYGKPFEDIKNSLQELLFQSGADYIISGLKMFVDVDRGKLFTSEGQAWIANRLVLVKEPIELDISSLIGVDVIYVALRLIFDPNAVCGELATIVVSDEEPQGENTAVIAELWKQDDNEGSGKIVYEPLTRIPVIFPANRTLYSNWITTAKETDKIYAGFCPSVAAVFVNGKPVSFSHEAPYIKLEKLIPANSRVVWLHTKSCSASLSQGGVKVASAVSSIKLTKA
jgi:hypothetical protein